MAGKHNYKTKLYLYVENGFGLVLGSRILRETILKAKKFFKTNWMCQCLKAVEKEGHIVSGQCEVYGDLSSQFGDLQEDKNLVQYFQAVMDRRDILEEEDRRQHSSTAVGASLFSGDRKSKTP